MISVFSCPSVSFASITARSVRLSRALDCLIENEEVRVAVKRPHDADALALTAGQPDTAFAYHRRVAILQTCHEAVERGYARGPLERGRVDLIEVQSKGDVGGNDIVEKEDRLRHVAHRFLPPAHIDGVDDGSVDA